MPLLTKFDSFVEHLAEGVHNLGADSLKVLLANSAPSVSNTVKADITEISAGNGYSAGGAAVTVTSSAQSSGAYALVASDLVITASGGSIGPFRYAVLYNDTPTSPADPLIGWVDYGSSITLAAGETFTLDLETTGLVRFNTITDDAEASIVLEFLSGYHRLLNTTALTPASLSGWSFTRASTGYASTSAGYLVAFATGVPRITDLGMLMEPAGTNLLLRSQEFDNGVSWSNSNLTVTANATTAPDGTLTADKLEVTTSAGTQSLQTVTAFASTSGVISIYGKIGSGATDANKFAFYNLTTATVLLSVTINWTTGAITHLTGSGATSQAMADGWWRIILPVTSGITSGDNVRLYAVGLGAAETAGEFCYLWGAQLEAGAFPTSYIPTTSAAATRAADVPAISSLNGVWPHTVVAEWMRLGGTDAATFYRVMTTSAAGVVTSAIYHRHTNNVVRAYVEATADVTGGTAVIGAVTKAAARFEANNVGISLNGAAPGTDVTVTAVPYDKLHIGNDENGVRQLSGYLRRLIIYPYAMTDAQLVAAST